MADIIERRAKVERRKFNYSAYFPERRSGKERRSVKTKMDEKKVA